MSLAHNIATIDACMCVHNMIVMARQDDCTMDTLDMDVFLDDARQHFSTTDDFEEGVHGGESDIRRDADGNASRGGRPPWQELQLAVVGRKWRDNHRDEIARQGLVWPPNNWYHDRNRVLSY